MTECVNPLTSVEGCFIILVYPRENPMTRYRLQVFNYRESVWKDDNAIDPFDNLEDAQYDMKCLNELIGESEELPGARFRIVEVA